MFLYSLTFNTIRFKQQSVTIRIPDNPILYIRKTNFSESCFRGPYKRAYIAVPQRLLRRCRNARAAIHEMNYIPSRALRLVHCDNTTFKFCCRNARAAMHKMNIPSRALRQQNIPSRELRRLVHCGSHNARSVAAAARWVGQNLACRSATI